MTSKRSRQVREEVKRGNKTISETLNILWTIVFQSGICNICNPNKTWSNIAQCRKVLIREASKRHSGGAADIHNSGVGNYSSFNLTKLTGTLV